MSIAVDPMPVPPPTRERYTIADLLHQLGDVAPERVHLRPSPGTATLDDLIAWNDHFRPTCEWIDGTLVEKATMGQFEGWLTFLLLGRLYEYLEVHDLGMVYTPDVVLRILPDLGLAPDISFVPWSALPNGKPPPRSVRVPEVVPALAVEVLSKRNTRAEMVRKRGDYFRAGVRIVWEIDPASQTAKVYTGPNEMTLVASDGVLEAGDVLPGLSISMKAVFDRATGSRPD